MLRALSTATGFCRTVLKTAPWLVKIFMGALMPFNLLFFLRFYLDLFRIDVSLGGLNSFGLSGIIRLTNL